MQLVLWLAGSYAAICAGGFLMHRHFMYFPNAERVAPATLDLSGVEEHELTSEDGSILIAWVRACPRRHGDYPLFPWQRRKCSIQVQ